MDHPCVLRSRIPIKETLTKTTKELIGMSFVWIYLPDSMLLPKPAQAHKRGFLCLLTAMWISKQTTLDNVHHATSSFFSIRVHRNEEAKRTGRLCMLIKMSFDKKFMARERPLMTSAIRVGKGGPR